jgi:hypothetical protein
MSERDQVHSYHNPCKKGYPIFDKTEGYPFTFSKIINALLTSFRLLVIIYAYSCMFAYS